MEFPTDGTIVGGAKGRPHGKLGQMWNHLFTDAVQSVQICAASSSSEAVENRHATLICETLHINYILTV